MSVAREYIRRVIHKGVKDIVLSSRTKKWCLLPYPDHPYGCPNFGYKETCPPNVDTFKNIFDMNSDIYLVAVEFDFAGYLEFRRKLNPSWSESKRRCVLYWQNTVNKCLRENCEEYIADSVLQYTTCPEALGVNVISTARRAGIPVETKPKDTIYKIALMGETFEVFPMMAR